MFFNEFYDVVLKHIFGTRTFIPMISRVFKVVFLKMDQKLASINNQ